MRKSTAGIIGFLVAPLISALAISATTPLFPPADIVGKLGMVPIFHFFSAMATLILGVPTFFLFRRLNLIRWWSVTGMGLVIGAVMAIVVSAQNHVQIPEMPSLAVVGAVSAIGFWIIWRLGNRQTGR